MSKNIIFYEIHDHFIDEVQRDLKMHIEAKTKAGALLDFLDYQQEILDVYVRDMYGDSDNYDYKHAFSSDINIMIVGAYYNWMKGE